MFIETQASPSILHTQTQEGSLSDRKQKSGQVRATQQQYDFTPTQTTGNKWPDTLAFNSDFCCKNRNLLWEK